MSARVVRIASSLAVLLACVGCDQFTKQIAVAELSGAPARRFLGGVFTLTYAENPGAFLGLGGTLPDGPQFWILTVAVGALLAGMLVWLLATRSLTRLQSVSAALLIGGGLSNWFDRLLNDGRVVDFMLMGIGPVRTGIFNVADIAIMGGVAVLFFSGMRRAPEAPPQQAQ